VSGVLAFRDKEEPTRQQMREVIDSFRKTVAPGLTDRQFNSLFVLHREKGNTEIHFVVPMVEFASGRGKRLNIHPPGERNLALYEAFTQVTSYKLGYGQVIPDTMRAAISVTRSTRSTAEDCRSASRWGDQPLTTSLPLRWYGREGAGQSQRPPWRRLLLRR
jgi:hypothetical protein